MRELDRQLASVMRYQARQLVMAEKCGIDLKDFIFKYTNIDTHKIENYL